MIIAVIIIIMIDSTYQHQELVYERPYMVLPPLVEWLRVATVFTETRFSTNVEKDDVFQVWTSDRKSKETKTTKKYFYFCRRLESCCQAPTSLRGESLSTLSSPPCLGPGSTSSTSSPRWDFRTLMTMSLMAIVMMIMRISTQVKRNTALQMLLSGRKDLVPHALQLLPASKVMMMTTKMISYKNNDDVDFLQE